MAQTETQVDRLPNPLVWAPHPLANRPAPAPPSGRPSSQLATRRPPRCSGRGRRRTSASLPPSSRTARRPWPRVRPALSVRIQSCGCDPRGGCPRTGASSRCPRISLSTRFLPNRIPAASRTFTSGGPRRGTDLPSAPSGSLPPALRRASPGSAIGRRWPAKPGPQRVHARTRDPPRLAHHQRHFTACVHPTTPAGGSYTRASGLGLRHTCPLHWSYGRDHLVGITRRRARPSRIPSIPALSPSLDEDASKASHSEETPLVVRWDNSTAVSETVRPRSTTTCDFPNRRTNSRRSRHAGINK